GAAARLAGAGTPQAKSAVLKRRGEDLLPVGAEGQGANRGGTAVPFHGGLEGGDVPPAPHRLARRRRLPPLLVEELTDRLLGSVARHRARPGPDAEALAPPVEEEAPLGRKRPGRIHEEPPPVRPRLAPLAGNDPALHRHFPTEGQVEGP